MLIHIGVAAHSSSSNPEIAGRFVNSLPENTRILLGGYWGIMRDVADAARRRGLQTVFFLPLNPPVQVPADEIFVPIDTGLDPKGRSLILVRSSDVLAVLGGEVGTMIEALAAYSYGKPVVILRGTGRSTDKLEESFKSWFDARELAPVLYVNTPEDLAREAVRLASRSP